MEQSLYSDNSQMPPQVKFCSKASCEQQNPQPLSAFYPNRRACRSCINVRVRVRNRERYRNTVIDPSVMKFCSNKECEQVNPQSAANFQKTHQQCKTCRARYKRENHLANPEKRRIKRAAWKTNNKAAFIQHQRSSKLKCKYGITPELLRASADYLEAQNGKVQ